jgi:hypothetical protein
MAEPQRPEVRRPGARRPTVALVPARPPSPRDDTPVYLNGQPIVAAAPAAPDTDDSEDEDEPADAVRPVLPRSPTPVAPRAFTPTPPPTPPRARAPSAPRTPAPAPAPPRVPYAPPPAAAPPRTLSGQMQHKMYRPNQLPAWEFFNSATAFEHLTDKDFYSTAVHFREKCQRIARGCPRAPPPEIDDRDTPAMAKYKYEMYYQQVAKLKSALQVGNLIYVGIMALQWFLTSNPWFKVKAHGLFELQYANREEYYEAMMSMGERTLGWVRSNVSGTSRMLTMFLISTVLLVAANYLIEWKVPAGARPMAHKAKDTAVKYFQDMASMFLGIKSVDPEKADDSWGSNLFAMASNLFTGQAMKPPSEAPTHLHDE